VIVAAVDASREPLASAIVEIGQHTSRVLASRVDPGPRSAAAEYEVRVLHALRELGDEVGLEVRSIEGYALGLGACRSSLLGQTLTALKGLALANGRPLVGISELQVLAHVAGAGVPAGTLLVPIVDAGDGRLHVGVYERQADGRTRARQADALLTLEELQARAGTCSGALAFGSGFDLHRTELSAWLKPLTCELRSPMGQDVADVAAASLASFRFDSRAILALASRGL